MATSLLEFPLIKQGVDFSTTLPLTSDTFSSADVTFTCHIRRYPGGPLLVDVALMWDESDLTFYIPAAATAKLPANLNIGFTSAVPKGWVYDLVVTFSDQTRSCLAEGPVYVEPGITTT